MIRNAEARDAKAISEIYNYYILNTVITFEESPVDEAEMARRIAHVRERLLWLVEEVDGEVIGYCYATEWRVRSAYRFSVESTVYLKNGCGGNGIGTKLYQELIHQLKHKNVHTVIGGISLPNDSSVALHEKMGFVNIARFKEVGFKMDKWVDVGYWQLLI